MNKTDEKGIWCMLLQICKTTYRYNHIWRERERERERENKQGCLSYINQIISFLFTKSGFFK